MKNAIRDIESAVSPGDIALNAACASHTDATYTDGRSIKMDPSCSYAKRRHHNSSGGSFVPSIEIT